jgi:hypothetical protein
MENSLNYLVAQERSAELRRVAEASRLGDELAAPGTPRRGGGRIRSTLTALWARATRTRASTPREPEAQRVHA